MSANYPSTPSSNASTVTISSNGACSPQQLFVQPGQQITFTNSDQFTKLCFEPASTFAEKSVTLKPGESETLTVQEGANQYFTYNAHVAASLEALDDKECPGNPYTGGGGQVGGKGGVNHTITIYAHGCEPKAMALSRGDTVEFVAAQGYAKVCLDPFSFFQKDTFTLAPNESLKLTVQDGARQYFTYNAYYATSAADLEGKGCPGNPMIGGGGEVSPPA